MAATHSKKKSDSSLNLSMPESTFIRFCNRIIEIGLMIARGRLLRRGKISRISSVIFTPVLPIAATVNMIIALVFTYSRGTWIGFLRSMMVLGIIAKPEERRTNY